MPTSSGNSIARTSIQDFTKNPRKTYFLITGIVAIIALLHLLPAATQQDLAHQITKQPWLLGVGLVIVMGFTYFNWIAGLLVLFLLICVTFPVVSSSAAQLGTQTSSVEGFANKIENDISLNNKHIKSLFEPGLLGKRVEEYRDVNKKLKAEHAAKEKSIQVLNSNRDSKLGSKNTGRKTENFKEIELRRFDPTSEDDMNLLLTMEHCGDVQNRIKYVYEDTKYLKKYIREKLEDIVDLLDLVPDDDR
jgi:predicted transcriptional regulator